MAGLADNVPVATAVVVPFPAVDEVVAARGAHEWVIRARKVITDQDPYLAGHFPNATIYPGVFVIESLRQAVSEGLGAVCDIMSVRSARFLMPLVSGDTLVLNTVAASLGDGMLAVTAEATIGHGGMLAARLNVLMSVLGAADVAAA
jgi:3-hydroxymyristoyl/3-hydroxydecanoyl-(acyl carrier protein) dehydratase